MSTIALQVTTPTRRYFFAQSLAIRVRAIFPIYAKTTVALVRAACALTPKIRGAYDAHKTYAHLDIIEYDGAGYLARRDAPGVPGIPGDGWQLMSRSGRRGPAGERGPQGRKGERGARGEDAPTIVSWTLDQKNYRAIPTLSNGT
jgi:hypothetical protein